MKFKNTDLQQNKDGKPICHIWNLHYEKTIKLGAFDKKDGIDLMKNSDLKILDIDLGKTMKAQVNIGNNSLAYFIKTGDTI